ncbi:MAG: hypothetical protein ABUL44_04865 [Flavobacterium sp.]
MKFWWQHWKTSTAEQRAEIQARYAAYASIYGELFEDKEVALTDEELEDVASRKSKFLRTWLIIFIAVMVFVSAALIFGYKGLKSEDYAGIVILVIGVLSFRAIKVGQFNNALKFREKRVVRGVITLKQMVKNEGCFVEFSRKLYIQILPEAFKTLSLGDIVRMEMLSDDVYMKRKVVIEGRI